MLEKSDPFGVIRRARLAAAKYGVPCANMPRPEGCTDERIKHLELRHESQIHRDLPRFMPVGSQALLTLRSDDSVEPELNLIAIERPCDAFTSAGGTQVLEKRSGRCTHPNALSQADVRSVVAVPPTRSDRDAGKHEVPGSGLVFHEELALHGDASSVRGPIRHHSVGHHAAYDPVQVPPHDVLGILGDEGCVDARRKPHELTAAGGP